MEFSNAIISDIDLLKSKLMSVKSFQEHAASIDTAYKEYEPTHSHFGKLHNHCGCVAYTNQKLFGGKIVSMQRALLEYVRWGRVCRPHFHQFDTTTPELRPVYSVHRVCPPRKTINPRFQKFYDRVVSLLHEYPEFL